MLLTSAGPVEQRGDWYTVSLPTSDDDALIPDLVAGLARLGARVHAVEPGRMSLEERLLGILRAGDVERTGERG
jgi:ABC-2 type transport system ATP-binding protein